LIALMHWVMLRPDWGGTEPTANKQTQKGRVHPDDGPALFLSRFADCPFISMSETTQGVRIQSGSQALRAGVELLSSMRFAISLLTVICIASVIGTVLKQHEPAVNYVNQFGPFWAELFGAFAAQRGVQRLVVPADPGVFGGQHLAVHRSQHAQDF
jgi:hypothetical protein